MANLAFANLDLANLGLANIASATLTSANLALAISALAHLALTNLALTYLALTSFIYDTLFQEFGFGEVARVGSGDQGRGSGEPEGRASWTLYINSKSKNPYEQSPLREQ